MKKILLSTIMMGLIALLNVNLTAQTWNDVIQEVKGDTAVVKGMKAQGGVNSLFIAVLADTNADGQRTNPNRVYETILDEVYLSDGTLELDASVPMLKIVAQPVSRTGTVKPPIHIKQKDATGALDKTFFQTPGSMHITNQYFCFALTDNTFDRELTRANGDSMSYVYEGCIFEFTNWTMHFPRASHQTFKFIDCLFLNVGNEATIEKGLPFDSWNAVDTLWWENNTVLNAGGIVVGRSTDNVAPNFAYFNHNTFVNATLPAFCFYSQAEMVVTNNMIINTGIVPDYPGFYPFHQDDDMLPKGVINIDTVEQGWIENKWPDGYPVDEADRKMMVDKNNTWWDSRFMDMFNNDLPAFPDTITETWAHQMFNMNSRTEAMFADDAAYPYLVEGDWFGVEPDFADNKDIITEWISFIVSNVTPGAPGGGDNMPKWYERAEDKLFEPDWPPVADLSYASTDLIDKGIWGYPIGDLNWFPTEKADWAAKSESDTLIKHLMAGTLVSGGTPPVAIFNPKAETVNVSVAPNPIADNANVTYTLTEGASVDVVIYNLLGEQVYVETLGYQAQGENVYTLNRGNLSSGMYILHINTSDSQTGLATKISIK